VDTIINVKVDTIITNHRNLYVRQQNIVDAYSSYFDKDIIHPGDFSHPVYKEHLMKANTLKQKVKAELLERVKNYPSQFAKLKLKNEEDFKNCELVVLPVYYLTPNVVSYNNELNLTPFFNLDTSCIIYRLVKNNQVIGIIGYKNGRSFLSHFDASDSLSYNQLIAMHQEPVAFITHIFSKKEHSNSNYTDLGYFSNGHIIFCMCYQGRSTEHWTGSTVTKQLFEKSIYIVSAEAYYLGSDSTTHGAILHQGALLDYINSRKSWIKLQPKQ
jgi:hypothetical protein